METNDYQSLWSAQSTDTGIKNLKVDALIQELQNKHQKLQKTLFWRDFREISIGVALLPVWIIMGLTQDALWSWYLMIPAILFVITFMVYLRYKNKPNQTHWGDSLRLGLEKGMRDLDHQIWMLKNVAIWYLAPFWIGILAEEIHKLILSSESFGSMILSLIFIATVSSICYAIWRLNQHAVSKTLIPHRDQLKNTLQELEV